MQIRKAVAVALMAVFLGAVTFFSAQTSTAASITVFGEEIHPDSQVTFCFTDDFGYEWTLDYNGEFLNGTAILRGSVLAPPPDCAKNAYDQHQVTNDTFSLTAFAGCGVEAFTYKGDWDPSTDTGTAVWANSTGSSGTINVQQVACSALQGADAPALAAPLFGPNSK